MSTKRFPSHVNATAEGRKYEVGRGGTVEIHQCDGARWFMFQAAQQ